MKPLEPILYFLGSQSAFAPMERLREFVQADWRVSATSTADIKMSRVVVIPIENYSKLKLSDLSALSSKVLVGTNFTHELIEKLQKEFKSFYLLDFADSLDEQREILERAVLKAETKFNQQVLLTEMRTQNKKIEELNTNLENIVHERTQKEFDSRQATKRALDHVRGLVGFVQDLTQSVDLPEILNLVRREIKSFHGTGDPILFLPHPPQLIYFQNLQVSQKSIGQIWEPSSRIRINSHDESQMLANQLGRPIAQVISFPLPALRLNSATEGAPILFFEHSLHKDEIDRFLNFIGERLQPVSLAIDRILLERELQSASRVWEQTFDGLAEPIAILDMSNQILRTNSHFRDELKNFLNSDGGVVRVGESRYVLEKYPIRLNREEHPLSWVAYFRDETRSMKLKSQMVQIEKMSAIGQLAGHIAHELNNPLTGIRSLAQILIKELHTSSPQLEGDLGEVERAAQRCQSIINNLLEFSRGGLNHKFENLDLNHLVEITLPLLKSVLGRFESHVDLFERPLDVKVEPHLMQQVIFNLVNNACQAIQGRGRIDVTTFAQANQAVLEVRDTGPGIPAHLKELIFEPFFTTKNEGEGTGLGLSLSRDFVRQFGGTLECETSPGEGAIFRVKLPMEPGR